MIHNHVVIREGLRLVGWSNEEVDHFIETHPEVWLQALKIEEIMDAISHIEVFLAYKEIDDETTTFGLPSLRG